MMMTCCVKSSSSSKTSESCFKIESADCFPHQKSRFSCLASAKYLPSAPPPTKQNNRATAGKVKKWKLQSVFLFLLASAAYLLWRFASCRASKWRVWHLVNKRLFNLVCICAGTVNHFQTFLARWRWLSTGLPIARTHTETHANRTNTQLPHLSPAFLCEA